MSPPLREKNNPYSAPDANLDFDAPAEGHRFLAGGKALGVDRVLGWYGRGFEIYKKSPAIWIVNCLIFLVILTVVGLIPVLGGPMTYFIMPVIVGGMMLGCHAQSQNRSLTVGHLLAGLKTKSGPLLQIGLFYTVGVALMFIVAGLIVFLGLGSKELGMFFGFMTGNKEAVGPLFVHGFGLTLVLAFLAIFMMWMILLMAVCFAPAFVVLHDMSAVNSIKASFGGWIKNLFPFFIFLVLSFVFTILATVPLLLGWLVFGPMQLTCIYAIYEDMFFE